MVGLVACGDNKPVRAGDAMVARPDAMPDAHGACGRSSDCPATHPICCLVLSPAGAGYTQCGDGSGAFCGEVGCRGADDPCTTLSGVAGTCTYTTFGFNQGYWVCR